ncbi:hypothetical protein [Actinomadura luteofluorescens]|uniref:hypothetical protein n=1 Tax=Actinomadura luteofluorescens TaxID=46163 RepID=UPI003D8FBBFC
MLLVLSLIVAALAAMVTAVAAFRRPLICCPAAGVASGILLVLSGKLAVAGYGRYGLAALACGIVAGGWGLAMALDYADRVKAEEDRARRAMLPDSSVYVLHGVVLEDVEGGAATTAAAAAGGAR